MLDKRQLTTLFDRLQTPRAGRELITRARLTAPVRPVKSKGGNVLTFCSSKKMGTDIRTESRHIEFAGRFNTFTSTTANWTSNWCPAAPASRWGGRG